MVADRYFTSKEAIKITGVSYRRLDLWIRNGIIRASRREAEGKGSRRLFTFSDLVEIRTLLALTGSGVKLSALVESAKRIRAEAGRNGVESLSSVRLITNGASVFRYLPELEMLESLDGYGQFAFAFGLGDHVKQLLDAASRLDRKSRYSSRPTKALRREEDQKDAA